jgi:hypothetical protein
MDGVIQWNISYLVMETKRKRTLLDYAFPDPKRIQVTEPVKKHRQSKEQLYLDFGQSKQTPQTCTVCRMSYYRGLAQDEALHKRYHQKCLVGIEWTRQGVGRDVWTHEETRVVLVDDVHDTPTLKKVPLQDSYNGWLVGHYY